MNVIGIFLSRLYFTSFMKTVTLEYHQNVPQSVNVDQVVLCPNIVDLKK